MIGQPPLIGQYPPSSQLKTISPHTWTWREGVYRYEEIIPKYNSILKIFRRTIFYPQNNPNTIFKPNRLENVVKILEIGKNQEMPSYGLSFETLTCIAQFLRRCFLHPKMQKKEPNQLKTMAKTPELAEIRKCFEG